jgi:hypothetical protein
MRLFFRVVICVVLAFAFINADAQQYPRSLLVNDDMTSNPAFASELYSDFKISASLNQISSKDRFLKDNIYAIHESGYGLQNFVPDAYIEDTSVLINTRWQKLREKFSFLNRTGFGYLREILSCNNAYDRTIGNYVTLSYTGPETKKVKWPSFGIQPGWVKNNNGSAKFDLNASAAVFGDKYRTNVDLWDADYATTLNYISIGAYHLSMPFARNARDTFSANFYKRIQGTFRQLLYQNYPFEALLQGYAVYNGNWWYNAGPLIQVLNWSETGGSIIDHTYVGAAYQSTGHILYQAGLRIHEPFWQTWGVTISAGYNRAIKGASPAFAKGFQVLVTIMPMNFDNIIVCQNRMHPDLYADSGK